jgi:hypothetical protein
MVEAVAARVERVVLDSDVGAFFERLITDNVCEVGVASGRIAEGDGVAEAAVAGDARAIAMTAAPVTELNGSFGSFPSSAAHGASLIVFDEWTEGRGCARRASRCRE